MSDKNNFGGAEELQTVTFFLGKEEYAVEILKVVEIIRLQNITRVPNASPFVEGVINLRGKVIPIVSARCKFGLGEKARDEKDRIIILSIRNIIVGMIVDSVSEVLRIPMSTIESSADIAIGIGSDYIKGIAKANERLVTVLDVDKLIDESDMSA